MTHPWAGSNFTPFRTIRFQLTAGAPGMKQIVGNVLLLMPIGFTLAMWRVSVRRALLALLAVSMGIEAFQVVIDRVSDVDDVILNVVGGVIGLLAGRGAVAAFRRFSNHSARDSHEDQPLKV